MSMKDIVSDGCELKLALYDESNCETEIFPDYIQDLFNHVGNLAIEYNALCAAYFDEEVRSYDMKSFIFHVLYKAKEWYKEGIDEFKD